MKSALCIAVLSLFLSLPVQAYEVLSGPILLCDTEKQVARFAELFDGNHQITMLTVNTEEKKANACALVDVSYIWGPALDTVRNRSYAFQIVPVVVIGVNTGNGYGAVAPVVFFAAVEVKELPA